MTYFINCKLYVEEPSVNVFRHFYNVSVTSNKNAKVFIMITLRQNTMLIVSNVANNVCFYKIKYIKVEQRFSQFPFPHVWCKPTKSSCGKPNNLSPSEVS
ncbi:hypothetical protein GQ457_15G020600 [Hibiscus cannabinus]